MINKINIKPGGQYSDFAKHVLGRMRHQSVINLRQDKVGDWEVTPGPVEIVSSGLSDVKAAIEVTEDRTGERFLLIQDGTSIKRINYSSGYGGAASTLTLPDGVSIESGVTLRFYYWRGVVRIAGASEPMWYGYIEQTLFKSVPIYEFTSDNDFFDDWTATNATKAFEPDAIGGNKASMLVTRTTGAGGVSQEFWTEVGVEYTVSVQVYKPTSANDTIAMDVGTTDGGGEYSTQTGNSDASWVTLTDTFTASSTSLFITLLPRDASGGTDAAYFFNFQLYSTPQNAREIDVADWVLLPTKINSYDDKIAITANQLLADTSADRQRLWMKTFFVYDDSQYSLMGVGENIYTGQSRSVRITLTISGSSLQSNFFNKRITGIGVMIAITDEFTKNDDDIVYRLHSIIPINDYIEDFKFYLEEDSCYYDTSNKDRLILNHAGAPAFPDTLGYFWAGAEVILQSDNDTLHTTIASISSAFPASGDDTYIVFDDNITALKSADTSGIISNGVDVTVKRAWTYSSGSGYVTRFGVSMIDTPAGDTFTELTGIPAGTTEISPNYSHHIVIEDIAYCLSLEEDEGDLIRYSPIDQYDVFPQVSLIATRVGDIDRIKAIAKRDNRLVIMKSNSLNQGNFASGSYYHDLDITDLGLFSEYGYVVHADTLFYIAKNDLFAFSGGAPTPLMKNEMQRQFYLENVNSSSLVFFDLLNNELLIKLGSKLIALDLNRREWYEKQTGYTILGGFLDQDRRLLLFTASKIITFNHSDSTYAETINFGFTTSVFADETAEFFSKLNKIKLLSKSNGSVSLTVSDPESASANSPETITPDTSYITHKRISPKFMFKQLQVVVAGSAAAANKTATIRNMELEVETWN